MSTAPLRSVPAWMPSSIACLRTYNLRTFLQEQKIRLIGYREFAGSRS